MSFIRPGELEDSSGLPPVNRVIKLPIRPFKPGSAKALLGYFHPWPRAILDTYDRRIGKKIKQQVQKDQPQIIIASETITAPYIPITNNRPTLLEDIEVGLHMGAWNDVQNPFAKFRRGLTWLKHRTYVKNLVAKFNACTTVSAIEKEILEAITRNSKNIYIIPNGVDLGRLTLGIASPQPNHLVYNGALTFGANYDAMRFFLAKIFPLIQIEIPDIRLTISGTTQGVDISELNLSPAVHFSGYMADIRPLVSSAWACVVPLRVGGGTRLKILEAMALGTPVIATSKGAEGLLAKPGKDLLIADDPVEFAASTIKVLRSPEMRRELASNGRHLVEKSYGWDQIGESFCRLVETTISRHQAN